tara:strand:+ start:353 stop:898 length:546 start_codon:yes stop_codon:yes gene_type:complete
MSEQKIVAEQNIKDENPMRKIKIAKVTLNIGAGKNEDMLKKGLTLLQKLSPLTPVKTLTKKRIPGWGLRPGLAIGCKVTIRNDPEQLLKRLLVAKRNLLSVKNFDKQGNFSFGIPEYIDIEGLEYDPDLKIIGLEVAVTLERPGYRIKHRKVNPAKIGKKHFITQKEAISFARESLNVEVQ